MWLEIQAYRQDWAQINGLGVASLKVLEAGNMDESSKNMLSEKLVRAGSSINTEMKGVWRECIEVYKVLTRGRRRTWRDHCRSQRYNELQAKE